MDDLISRQAAIDAIDEYMVGKNCATDGTMIARLINELVIKRLPPAEPKRGEWVKDKSTGYLVCDQCRDVYINPEWPADGHWKFCPNCGAKMG